MALKGTATIELTNADGSKEIINHDNMITNAPNDLCMSQRGDIASILKIVNNNDSYAQALFGGLLLFGDVLNDNPDDYFIPSTNIIGYASQDAYAGLDVARGSFNASEGGLQEDGSYKFVWDFATSQANGTIKALALCPNVMGQIGASATIQDSELKAFQTINTLKAPFETNSGRMLDSNGTTDGISNYCFNIVAIVGDIAYAMMQYNVEYRNNSNNGHYILNNGGILYLYKFKLGANNVALGDRVCMARYLGREDIQLPTEFTNDLSKQNAYYGVMPYYDHESGILTVYPCYKKAVININGTMKYIDIDLKNNMAITIHTFTNSTAGSIDRIGYTNSTGGRGQDATLIICKDYIVNFSIVNTKYNKMYITKRSNNEVKQVMWSTDEEFLFEATNKTISPIYSNKNIMIFRMIQANGNSYYYYILDMETGIIKKTNANSMSFKHDVDIGNKSVVAATDTYLAYDLVVNPFVLTTKNNLDSPVMKTASQTMKITYILTELTESGV